MRLKSYLPVFGAILITQVLAAQKLSIVSGNGQAITNIANFSITQIFAPLVVQATDNSGNPLANVTITWTVTSGPGSVSGPTTVTASDGTSSNTYTPNFPGFGNATQPFSQTILTATAGSSTVTFTETAVVVDQSGGFIWVQGSAPTLGGTALAFQGPISGSAGSQGSAPIISGAFIQGSSQGIPAVSLRLFSNQASPTVNCATAPGADPGSVLTDSTGFASCTPVFGGGPGTGTYFVVVGGAAPTAGNPGLNGLVEYGPFNFTVTAATVSSLKIVSGNSQTGNPGQALSPLVAQVVDAKGNPISGQTVNWTASPATAVTLSSTSSTSDSNGQARTTPTLSASANGQIQVVATLAANTKITATFTLTAVPPVTITSLTKVSGDQQTAAVDAAFANPLVVQVATSSGSGANVPVQFSISGPGTLTSNASAVTNSSGQAQASVQAGDTPGNITVTASAGNASVSFTLFVAPPGPSITSNSFFNAADLQPGFLSPCSLATVTGDGVAPNYVVPAIGFAGSLYSSPNESVTVGGVKAPIFNVAATDQQEQLTFQVPCEVTPGNSVPIAVTVNGGTGTANVKILPASPGVFLTTMSDGKMRALLERPDGTIVTLENPARLNEPIIAFVTGMGPTAPSVGTNALPIPEGALPIAAAVPVPSGGLNTVIVGVNHQGAPVIAAQLSPDMVGVYWVTFTVPGNAPVSNDVPFSVAVVGPTDGVKRESAGTTMPISK